jgi:hypothetical protein
MPARFTAKGFWCSQVRYSALHEIVYGARTGSERSALPPLAATIRRPASPTHRSSVEPRSRGASCFAVSNND